MSNINIYGGRRTNNNQAVNLMRNIKTMNVKKESNRMLKKFVFSALTCLFISALCVHFVSRLTDPLKMTENTEILISLTKTLHSSLILWRNSARALEKIPQWAINGTLSSMSSIAINLGSFKLPNLKRALATGASTAAISSMLPRGSTANALNKILNSVNKTKSRVKIFTGQAGRIVGTLIGAKSLSSYYVDLFNAIARQVINILIAFGYKVGSLTVKQIKFAMANKTNKLRILLGPNKTNQLARLVINKIKRGNTITPRLTNTTNNRNINAARTLMGMRN